MVSPTLAKDIIPTEQRIEATTRTIPATPTKNPVWIFDGKEPIAKEI